MKKIKSLAFVLIGGMILNSCQKGATGPQGPAGSNGTNGVANITMSNITVKTTDWALLSPSTDAWYYNTSAIIPTTDVCNVYYSTDNKLFAPLPYSNVFITGDITLFKYQTGVALQLQYYNPVSKAAPSATLYYNIADIPPAVMNAHPNTNWNDFTQVKAIMQTEKNNK